MRDTPWRTWIIAALLGFLVSASSHVGTDHVARASSDADQAVAIDPRRSLVVTEQPILARFAYQKVLEQIVASSGVPGLTALALHQQWWNTQNPGPGYGPHCDDYLDDFGKPSLNSFPYTCRPAPSEGAQAVADPFTDVENNPDSYVPVGLFNRFDLAPSDGAHCGEYRIIFAIHVSERATEVVDGVTRFVISPALQNAFIPRRLKILEEFLTKEEKNKAHDKHRPH